MVLSLTSNPFDGTQLCAQIDGDMFFPDELEDTEEVMSLKTMTAKAVCIDCPIQLSCLTYAVEHPELLGIWGGMTTKERRLLRRRIRSKV